MGSYGSRSVKAAVYLCRPKPKEHGLGNQIEGFYEEGKKVVVIEDLISTGKSSLLVVEVLKNAGLQVEGLVSIFNYGFGEATDAFEKAKINFQSLTDYDSLIDIGYRKKYGDKCRPKYLVKLAR